MSTVYTGNPANVTTPLAATVSGATNASPIVITTTANHLYATADRVTISGVVGNTAANGAWSITVLSSTTFSLTGSTGNGAYVSGGTCSNASLTPQFTIPSDGDVFSAATFNVAYQALADRTQYLALQTSPLPSLTALAAITTPANGLVRQVLGFGWYVFQTSATTGLSPFRVAAADATPGGWVSSSAHETTLTRLIAPANVGQLWTTQSNYTPSGLATVGAWWPVLGGATTDVQRGNSGSISTSRVTTASATAWGIKFGLDPYLVDGSTLSSITMRLQGIPTHVALPALMPQFGVLRSDKDDTVVGLLSTGNGLVTDPTALLATFIGSHDVTFTPNSNNVIDRTNYSYSLIYWTEGSTNALAGDIINSFSLAMTGIPDARRS